MSVSVWQPVPHAEVEALVCGESDLHSMTSAQQPGAAEPLASGSASHLAHGGLTRRQLLRAAAGAGALAVGVGPLSGLLRTSAAFAAPPERGTTQHPADVATAWFDQLNELVRATPGFSPPVASRAFAYAGVALYEAVVPGSEDHRSLVGQLNGLGALPRLLAGPHHWGAAANAALAAVARGLWPTAPESSRTAVGLLEARIVGQLAGTAPHGVLQRSERWGREVAAAVLRWSTDDGGHEGYLRNFPPDYQPPSGPGLWEPTPPDYLPALQPHWGANRPFLTTTTCGADIPTAYSQDPSSRWHAEAMEVHTAVSELSEEQERIAHFWSDDPGTTATPAGHSNAILTQVLRAGAADLATAGEAYAKVGIAVADAFIACWRAKYDLNVLRPITYLQAHVDKDWGTAALPLPLTTPPFPEYPSGHSVQSGAVAEVLTGMFGEGYAFIDTTHEQRGLAARSFDSFEAAAQEAAISRLYGGIHFRPAIVDGLDQGRCVGRAVLALQTRA